MEKEIYVRGNVFFKAKLSIRRPLLILVLIKCVFFFFFFSLPSPVLLSLNALSTNLINIEAYCILPRMERKRHFLQFIHIYKYKHLMKMFKLNLWNFRWMDFVSAFEWWFFAQSSYNSSQNSKHSAWCPNVEQTTLPSLVKVGNPNEITIPCLDSPKFRYCFWMFAHF